ncbi:VOC family protein [Halalkalibaculum sp. DA384]|uniref:VOC family protein n=1 Tax=Halalkalibaculum sp. DA384 TaxID=3373606 RepID=UPI0037549AD5
MKSTESTPIQDREVWANLPVEDVEQTREFYRELGFKPNEGRNGEHLASFLVVDSDFIVHFFQRDMFEQASGGNAADLTKRNEIMFTISADSKSEVDEWARKAKKAGGSLFNKPAEIQNGWYGCGFADPDGHKWNVFYNRT